MIIPRPNDERGHSDYGWLQSHHSFSFADYVDPAHKGYSALRVINDDTVAPGAGFPDHPHRDMEIVSYVTQGALQHRDSLGNGSIVRAGEVQRMTAGTGITHSEFNASDNEPVHFFQIWIYPNARGLAPAYEQRQIDEAEKKTDFLSLASGNGTGLLSLRQDATVYVTGLAPDQSRQYQLGGQRKAYVHITAGNLQLNSHVLKRGDGAYIDNEPLLNFSGITTGEVLLFDLPGTYP